MDESTDVAGLAILLVIVRYPYESYFEEDMIMCSPLPSNTIGEEIFNEINIFVEENNLSLNDCIDIYTDGVKATTGKTAGAVSRIKNKVPNCSSSHCIVHRSTEACSNLKLVMDEVYLQFRVRGSYDVKAVHQLNNTSGCAGGGESGRHWFSTRCSLFGRRFATDLMRFFYYFFLKFSPWRGKEEKTYYGPSVPRVPGRTD
ncbi:Zinc finger BED domain-containing protein 5 [Eumeta japonica]|uniref:Zinc finger BED domain-containing protein 5 n=1 Tax=Eumeta variegata TaxID=151549 RepID=A0A4C1ZW18_EUMVA|nr:Zinc finger BED domain-containing protein 5 [Eumeta japonica]